eukprot:557083-Hanusia_phi.AAC.1
MRSKSRRTNHGEVEHPREQGIVSRSLAQHQLPAQSLPLELIESVSFPLPLAPLLLQDPSEKLLGPHQRPLLETDADVWQLIEDDLEVGGGEDVLLQEAVRHRCTLPAPAVTRREEHEEGRGEERRLESRKRERGGGQEGKCSPSSAHEDGDLPVHVALFQTADDEVSKRSQKIHEEEVGSWNWRTGTGEADLLYDVKELVAEVEARIFRERKRNRAGNYDVEKLSRLSEVVDGLAR